MKNTLFIILIFVAFNSHADSFLSFTTKNTLKIEKPKQVNPMFSAMTSMMKDQVKESKTYISGKIKAIHNENGQNLIFNYNDQTVTSYDKQTKEYWTMPIKKYYERIFKKATPAGQESYYQITSFKELNKRKKVSGYPCKMFSTKAQFKMVVGNVDQEVRRVECVLQKKFQAWEEISSDEKKSMLPYYKKMSKKGKDTYKNLPGVYDPLNGIVLFSKYKFNMDFGAKGKPAPKGMSFPKISSNNKTVVKSISEKPFNLSKLSVPKGFKKVKSL